MGGFVEQMPRSSRMTVAARLEVAGHQSAAEALRQGTVTNHISSAGDVITVNCDVAVSEDLLPYVVTAEEILVEAVRASFSSNWEMGLDIWVQITASAPDSLHLPGEQQDEPGSTRQSREVDGYADRLDSDLAEALGATTADRLATAIAYGFPPEALAVTARWWQLESYLRQLVYIELRARFGLEWETQLSKLTLKRADAVKDLAYMASPDDEHLLTHLDVGELFRLIGDSLWDECRHGVGMRFDIWKGKVEELTAIRHRMAHCRRPHADDASRLEQALRDLEPAAHRALYTYAEFNAVSRDLDDPVVVDWCRGKHAQSGLVEHGGRKGIWFHLGSSRRPWATPTEIITGTPGYLWVMFVVVDHGYVRPVDYWCDSAVRVSVPNIGHVLHTDPRHLKVTFPAVDDPSTVSDAIGRCFEAVFDTVKTGTSEDSMDWRRGSRWLDGRVDVEGTLSVLSGLHQDDSISLFGAT